MSSGGGSQVIGYWYKYLQALVLCKGPVDAILEFRAGGRTAWKGVVTETSQVYVNARNLWGGQKKEGGVQGFLDLQLGDADQEPNDYLAAKLGSAQPSYRGLALAVWRGGLWGAMNPYPKRSAWKVRRILADWDNDDPWYPEKAAIALLDGSVTLMGEGWEYKVQTFEEPNNNWDDFTVPTSGWLMGGDLPFSTNGMSGGPYWTPARSNIWLRRQIHVASSGITMHIAADNGCVVWVNGVNVGSSNPTNSPIPGNDANPVSYSFIAAGVVDVLVKAFAEISASDEAGNVVSLSFTGVPLLGMNPAHALYDSVTASDMQGEPVALINDASFRAAADQLYAEGLGICTYYDYDETIEDFQERILRIIGGALTFSREHGEYYLDLIRPTEDPDSLTTITSDDIVSITLEPTTITEQVNEVIVEWFDVENVKKRSTPPMQSRGAVHAAGRPIPETIKYPEIAIESLAMRLAARDLAAMSTPLSKVTVTTNRRGDIWKLRPGLKARIQAPEEGVTDMIIVVGDIEYGTLKDGRIKIIGVQDVYSMPETTYVTVQPSQAPPVYSPPAPPPAQRLIEAPYVEVVANLSAADLAVFPDDSGVIMSMAVEPSSGLNYSLYSAPAGADLEETGSGEWCPSALINEAAGYMDTAFTLSGASGLELVEVGSWALWDDEIVRVDAIDEDALTVTLGRGCADTVPWQHVANSRIWFCGDWSATDGAQYLDGDTINAKLLTRTSIDEMALESASLLTVDMDQRWFRPYPPAGLLINSESYPEEPSGDLTFEWSDRDRVMQSDQLIDATVASIGPEAGTTYDIELWDRDTETLYHSVTSVTSPATVLDVDVPYLARLEVWTVRDGLRSWQAATADFTHGAELWTPAHLPVPPEVWLDWDSDLTEVSGRASAWVNNKGSLGGSFGQPDSGARPTVIASDAEVKGKRVLAFDGANDTLYASSGDVLNLCRNVGTAWAFVVYKKRGEDASPVNRALFVARNNASAYRFGLTAGGVQADGHNRPSAGGRRLDSDAYQGMNGSVRRHGVWSFAMAVGDYSTRSLRLFVDGSFDSENATWLTTGSTSNTASGAVLVGSNTIGGTSDCGDVDIALVIAGSSALSEPDIDRIHGWSAWQLGLESSLDVGHPYKDEPPTA